MLKFFKKYLTIGRTIMYNYIIKKGGKEKLNNGIKARTKHCLSRGKDVGLTEKRGASAFFYFFKKTLPIIIILTDLSIKCQVFFYKKIQ